MQINYSNQKLIKNQKTIFLAGPASRTSEIDDWRNEAIKYFEKYNFDGVLYNPIWDDTTICENDDAQALWEFNALTESTVILFWVPRQFPENPGLTTNIEFGYWINSEKVIYGRPDKADKIYRLDWNYRYHTSKEPINNLEQLVKESIKFVNEKYFTK